MTPYEIVKCIDLTNLTEGLTTDEIWSLCNKAIIDNVHVASVCIYQQYISSCKTFLNPEIAITSVANFPDGINSLAEIEDQIKMIIQLGAAEIDVVIPFNLLNPNNINQSYETVLNFTKHIRSITKNFTLKIIIETSRLKDKPLIESIGKAVIDGDADFIKSSTGKNWPGISMDALQILCPIIKQSKKEIGLKISGGIATLEEATNYINYIESILGRDFLTPKTFRIGTSRLLNKLIEKLHDSI
jgi:deoxyribose-phosphate aldolase